MNWTEALDSQLYEIAYHDQHAPIEQFAAAGELKRRASIRFRRVNHKLRAVYPR